MQRSPSAGGVIVGPKDLIVVVNQDGLVWSLPKGKLDNEEDEKAAATREIEEETGITSLRFVKKLGTYERFKIGADGISEDKSIRKIITIFLYSTDQEKLEPIDPHNPEARWVEPDKVAGLLSHPKDKDFFQKTLPEIKEFIATRHKT